MTDLVLKVRFLFGQTLCIRLSTSVFERSRYSFRSDILSCSFHILQNKRYFQLAWYLTAVIASSYLFRSFVSSLLSRKMLNMEILEITADNFKLHIHWFQWIRGKFLILQLFQTYLYYSEAVFAVKIILIEIQLQNVKKIFF